MADGLLMSKTLKFDAPFEDSGVRKARRDETGICD